MNQIDELGSDEFKDLEKRSREMGTQLIRDGNEILLKQA